MDAHQAGVRDGYTGDRIDEDLFVDPSGGAAYRRGLREGRTQRVDEELLAGASTHFVSALDRQFGKPGMAGEDPAGPGER